MSIKDWPKDERPRERLFSLGPEALTDTELLAILIVSGTSKAGLTALDCARAIMQRYLTLRDLTSSSYIELCQVPGIGPGKASRIQVAIEIGRRVVGKKRELGSVFNISQDVFESYSVRLRDEKQEKFTVVLLDSKNRLIKEEVISLGTLNYSVVHPREVFRPAIRESAASVIFVHNHPSGDPSPSKEDMQLTERLVKAGKLLGIRVLDHIIIGEGSYYSFCDQDGLESTHHRRQSLS